MGRLARENPIETEAVKKAKGLEKSPRALLTLPSTPLLVNHFKIGADPEFMLMHSATMETIYGSNFSLKETGAIGIDHNQRHLEVRPAPSRWALEVLASAVDTLRMTAMLRPSMLKYDWVCPPYLAHSQGGRDGIGGHVHFGRKAGELKEEVQSLDEVTRSLLKLRVFDPTGFENRRKHSQGLGGGQEDIYGNIITHYGAYGDVRKQSHGYEYRTYPSWLSSPWQAYLVLTLSKLLVHEPELTPDPKIADHGSWITNLLLFFQDKDEDARLALWALREIGIPQYVAGDFKKGWGLPPEGYPASGIDPIPPSMPPTRETCEELFKYLLGKSPLPNRVVEIPKIEKKMKKAIDPLDLPPIPIPQPPGPVLRPRGRQIYGGARA